MSRMQRDKGANAERAAAIILRTIYPDATRRVSGEEGQGENLGRDLKGTPGLCVQVKEMAAPRPLAALEEALRARVIGEIPVAIVRQSSRRGSTPFRAVLPLVDLLHLLHVYEQFRASFPRRTIELDYELAEKFADLAEHDPGMKARLG